MQHSLAFPFPHAHSSLLAGLTVMQVIPSLDDGVAERAVVDLAAALTEAGARALVACTGGALVSELQARGGVWAPFPADSRNPLAMANNVRKLRDLIRLERPAVLHAHAQGAAWVALGATQLTGTPLVTSFGGRAAGRQSVAHHYDSVLVRGDLVMVPSDHAADLAADAFPWVRERLRVAPAGVDTHRFTAAAVSPARVEALRTCWGLAPDPRIVLVPDRPAARHGHATLVEAAALLRAEGLGDAVFVLPGEPSPRGYGGDLARLIAERGLGDVVRLVGPLSDPPAAMLAASLVVLPAAQPDVGGLPALEAQAMGVPVVMSDGGVAAEVLLTPPLVPAGQRTGWRVPAEAPEALAAAVREALALGASARDALATRARARVERGFSRDRMVEATLDAYAAVIEARPSQLRASHG